MSETHDLIGNFQEVLILISLHIGFGANAQHELILRKRVRGDVIYAIVFEEIFFFLGKCIKHLRPFLELLSAKIRSLVKRK